MQDLKKIKILFEDDYLVIVDKPAGLLVVPTDNLQEKDLTALLNESSSPENIKNTPILPCHRLDKETSGVMIFARGQIMQQLIMDEFRSRNVCKHYIAFVQGSLDKKTGILKNYIKGAWPYNKHEKKKIAITKYEVLYQRKELSILRVEPVTGRTNQIRIQFKNIGHPLVGERRFAFARDWPIRFKRVCLHAASIEFKHPQHKNKLVFKSELPQDMKNFLQKQGIRIGNIF
ncbi:MAG: RluA family pseudouridine synthase [Candidatus Omnitrophota bacterium]